MSSDGQKDSSGPRVAGVIVSHGQLASEFLAAAEMIVGPVSHITAVSIGWHDDVEAAREEIEHAIEKVSRGGGVLILTDMFGGTPTNIASMFLTEGTVEVITGVNLPMVVKLATHSQGMTLSEVAQAVRNQGQEGIYLAGDLLAPKQKAWVIETRVKIINPLGLHARAAAMLVRTAGSFASTVRLERCDGTASADAKSILSVLLLAAAQGTELVLSSHGQDENEAISAVCVLFADGFGERER